MKTIISLLSMLCLIANVSLAQAGERLSIKPGDNSLPELISEIESNSDLNFAYSLELINKYYNSCYCDISNLPVNEALDQLFENSKIGYEISNQQITLFHDKKKSVPSFNLHGYISDATTGEKLIGANVVNLNNTQGTTSNEYGYFSFSQDAQKMKVAVSYIGYKPYQQEIRLNADQQLSIRLEPALELEEIVVTARESMSSDRVTQMSLIELDMREIKAIPNLAGEVDVLRAFQLMPGVATATEGNTGMYVRGGGPDQNLFLLDDVPLYHPSHLLGFLSVFNEDAINKATLIKGGFPARYGGRLSSIIDVRTKDGNQEGLKGNINLGLISSKFSLDGPLGSPKTSFILSARTTYLGPVVNALYKQAEDSDVDVEGTEQTIKNKFKYNFFDVNAKLTHELNQNNKLFASFHTGMDRFRTGREEIGTYNSLMQEEYELESNENSQLRWGNNIASLRWNRIYDSGLFSKVNLIYGRYHFLTGASSEEKYRSESTEWNAGFENSFESGIRDIGLKIDFQKSVRGNHDLRFGAGSIHHKFNVGALDLSESSSLNTENTETLIDTLYGASKIKALESYLYVEDHVSITELLSFNAGLHLSAFNVQGEMYSSLQPRLLARWQFAPGMAVKASYTHMQQYLHLLTRSGVGLPNDLWVPPTKNIKPQKSTQLALGYVWNASKMFELSVETYYKKMNNLLSYAEGVDYLNLDDTWEEKVVQGKGKSYGMEVLLKKKRNKFTGWIGYTLSKSTRQFDEINFGRQFLYKYDRRHDLSLVASYQLNDRVTLNANWVYATGNKVSFALNKYNFNISGETIAHVSHVSERNNVTLPATHRLDISVNFAKELERGKRVWTFGLYNAYNRSNPVYLDLYSGYAASYSDQVGSVIEIGEQPTEIKKQGLIPIIPSINYSRTF